MSHPRYFDSIILIIAAAISLAIIPFSLGQEQARPPALRESVTLDSLAAQLKNLEQAKEGQDFENQALAKQIDDHLWYNRVAYAGVPVSDLVARMGYKNQSYRDLYSAPHHIGKTAEQNVNEYRRRSPAWSAEKLQTPLLIHTNTSDEDVNVLEVEHLVQALLAAGKKDKFEYKIYQNAPGGHSFNRLDTRLAREYRQEVYRFLARYLAPPNPPR